MGDTSTIGEPKLALTKTTTSTGPFKAGDRVDYTVTLQNTGTSPAYNISMTDVPSPWLRNVVSSSVQSPGYEVGPTGGTEDQITGEKASGGIGTR